MTYQMMYSEFYIALEQRVLLDFPHCINLIDAAKRNLCRTHLVNTIGDSAHWGRFDIETSDIEYHSRKAVWEEVDEKFLFKDLTLATEMKLIFG